MEPTIDFYGANIHICETIPWLLSPYLLILLGGSKNTAPYPAKTQEWQNTYTYPIRCERKTLSPKSLHAIVYKSVIFMSISSSKFAMFSHAVVSSLSPQVIIVFVFAPVSISSSPASSPLPLSLLPWPPGTSVIHHTVPKDAHTAPLEWMISAKNRIVKMQQCFPCTNV